MVDTCKGDLKKKLQTVKGGSVSVIVEEASCRRRGSFSVLVWEMFSGESFPCWFSRIFLGEELLFWLFWVERGGREGASCVRV